MVLQKIFVLTSRSIHLFQERDFTLAKVEVLPIQKSRYTTYQRHAKILLVELCNYCCALPPSIPPLVGVQPNRCAAGLACKSPSSIPHWRRIVKAEYVHE